MRALARTFPRCYVPLAIAAMRLDFLSPSFWSQEGCWILDTGDFDRLSDMAPLLKITLLENLAKDMASKLRCATQWIGALA